MRLSIHFSPRHFVVLQLLLLYSSSLFGCSGITNTIAGLTTPQSTISGSTYPYWVDPATNKLKVGCCRFS